MSIKKKLFFTVRKIGRLFYRGHIWLISDRKGCAGDNGEAMFLYLKDKKVKTVFAISKEAKDYERLKKIGGVVAYDSKLYKLLLCIADVHISSQLAVGNLIHIIHINHRLIYKQLLIDTLDHILLIYRLTISSDKVTIKIHIQIINCFYMWQWVIYVNVIYIECVFWKF